MADRGGGIVGRRAELDAIDAALDRLAHGRAVAVHLAGEPGIGKSRLLAELGTRADARGMLVLAGSASEFERDLPFWLFVDALDEYLRAAAPGRLDALDADARGELAHVLPSRPVATPDGPDGPAREDRRYRTHRAVRRLLEVLAGPAPLVLLLDDLHWADSGSVELLCALLRRPPAAPVLIGTAVRPRQAPDRLAGALDRAAAGGLVGRLELGGLSLAECRKMLGSTVDGAVAAALHTESGGNPFYLGQLARSGRATAPATVAGPPDDGLPSAVATAISDELAMLDRDTRRVLEAAAVTGDPFVLELAAAAAALPEEAVATALDDLQRRDLVRPTDAPRRFRFRHPLLRRAVYDTAPRAWRLGAHERAAAALAARGVPPSGRAHHVVQAARRGDPGAVALLRTAGDAVVRRAPGEAARWYRAAVDLLAEPESADAVGLWAALGGALGAAGRLADARAAQLRAIDLLPDDAVTARVQLVADCARIEHTLGHHDEAHRRLVATLHRLPDTHPAEAVALMGAIALDHLYRGNHDDARDWAGRARAAAGPLGDPLLRADAGTGLALSAAFAGASGDAATACAEAASLIDALTDEQIGTSADPVVARLAAAELFIDRYAAATRHVERGLAVARANGSGHHVPILYWTGTVRAATGRLPEAAALLDDAIDIARSSGSGSMLGWVLLARSGIATACGDTDVALATAEESTQVHYRGAAGTLPATWAALALAAALLHADDPAPAVQALSAAAGGEALPLLPHPLRPAAFELLTRCHLALADPAAAVRAADAAAACARESGLASGHAVARRAAAAIALHEGDPARAADLARAAATAAESIGAVVEAATARELSARAFALAGDPDRAAVDLRLAAATFERCGAPRRRAGVERQLRRIGDRRVHHRTRAGDPAATGFAALTEREWQVARLVTDRRTNSQIAAELFLSRKTVETHIRNLFRKLAVSSRVDIARAVERFDRDVPAP